jgi:hypothetical protein
MSILFLLGGVFYKCHLSPLSWQCCSILCPCRFLSACFYQLSKDWHLNLLLYLRVFFFNFSTNFFSWILKLHYLIIYRFFSLTFPKQYSITTFFFFFCSTGVWTQGLLLAKQALPLEPLHQPLGHKCFKLLSLLSD